MTELQCIVCGAKADSATGYAFMENGQEQARVPFCRFHLDHAGLGIANPVFQNRVALELFIERHPQLYTKFVKGKRIVFLEATR